MKITVTIDSEGKVSQTVEESSVVADAEEANRIAARVGSAILALGAMLFGNCSDGSCPSCPPPAGATPPPAKSSRLEARGGFINAIATEKAVMAVEEAAIAAVVAAESAPLPSTEEILDAARAYAKAKGTAALVEALGKYSAKRVDALTPEQLVDFYRLITE